MPINLGHLKIINFPFETMVTLLFLGVPILKHITVIIIIPNTRTDRYVQTVQTQIKLFHLGLQSLLFHIVPSRSTEFAVPYLHNLLDTIYCTKKKKIKKCLTFKDNY